MKINKAGIYFNITNNKTITIGTKSKGNIKNLYFPLNEKSKKGNTLEEILIEIIERARDNYERTTWFPCPRNVGISVSEKINNLYDKIKKEDLKKAITENNAYLKDAEKIIKLLGPEFTTNQFKDKSSKLKLARGTSEIGDSSKSRMHIESFICKGKLQKVQQGDFEDEYKNKEHKRNTNRYKKINRSACPYLKEIDGVYHCTCKKDFKETKLKSLRPERVDLK